MSQNKLLSLLGIARRAGRLSLGNDPALEAMRNGQTCVILVANDLSKRTLKGVCFAAEEAHITMPALQIKCVLCAVKRTINRKMRRSRII